MSDYDDDPLVRALRAPGTPDELAGEGTALRAYREAFPGSRRSRRALGRLGLGGSAFVLSIALGGGVAAAYTQTLPDQVQDFAHGVLGPVGVPPAAARGRQRSTETAAPAGPDTASAPTDPTDSTTSADPTGPTSPPTSPPAGPTSPGPGEATTRAAPGGGTSPVPSPGQPSPTAPSGGDPTAPPTSPPSTPPTTTPPTQEPPPPPATRPKDVSVAVSATKVDPGTAVTVSGTVTDKKGASVAGRTVRLGYRTAGGAWTTYATQTSASDGTVSFTSPPLAESLALRLAVKKDVISDKVRIEVEPALTVSAAPGAVDVAATGGQAGDTVVLVRVTTQGRREVGRQQLTGSGSTSFGVEPATRRTVYVARLLRTPRHLPADGKVVVKKEARTGVAAPAPSVTEE